MEYKVSYQKNWNQDGTCYDQCIMASMTEAELQSYNNEVATRKKAIHAKGAKTSDETKFMCFARFLLKGKNHTTLTMRDLFVSHFGISDKRILNRNTLIIVNIK